jgi:lysophospholipase L1-like esterase
MRKQRLLTIMSVAIVCAALITAAGSAFAVKSVAASTPWTGTWSVSPESGGQSFGQQTLRQIVHTSIGGTSAQVQVSNVFGSAPLVVADVHVALRSSGSTIVSGSDHTVTFGGQTSITIPAGGLAISDAVAISVPALSDVAVSMYLPQSTGASTYHAQGTATNYIASGDVSGNGSLSGAQTTNSYFFLTNLNVQNTAAQGAVVTFGASITDGYASTTDANERWPNDLAVRLANSGRTIGVLNQGISGNRLLVDSSGSSGQSALDRFNRDVLSQPGVKWVIFSDDPINDLGSTSPPPTSAQLIAGLQQLISTAHQNGIKFLCSTLTPYQGAGYWTQQGETAREAYNAYVLGSGSGCDGVVDQAAAVSNPSDPTMYLPAYDSGDHLHPNDAGYQAIANAVNLNLFGSAPTSSSLAATFNNVGITADNDTAPGNFDGNDASFSETALTNAGAAPGASITSSGASFTFPNVAAGTDDNTVAEGQTISMSGSGTLAFLLSASYGPASGTGTVTYTDGSTQSYALDAPDWWSAAAPSGGAVAVNSAYQNRPGNITYAHTGDIFSETVTLTPGKSLASVTLPPGGALTTGTPAVHIFAIATTSGAEGPYGGTGAAIPGTVQAANYDTGGQGVAYNVTSVNGTANSYRPDGVDLEACTDTGCGHDLGWTATGQWFKYTVNVATAGTYTVSFRVASPNGATDGLHLANPAGTNLSGAVSVPDTGGWQDWATVTATVTLPAGQQTLTLDQDNGGWNVYYMAFSAASGTGSALTAPRPA